MPLYVFNKSGVPVSLVGLPLVPPVPASTAPPIRSLGVNITSDLKNLTVLQYAALEAQRLVSQLEYQWTDLIEYTTGSLLTLQIVLALAIAPVPFPIVATQSVFVRKDGSDTTGIGSVALPFFTIQKAMDSILDSSFSKRYAIEVGAGSFDDPFLIKPWTSVLGVPCGTGFPGSLFGDANDEMITQIGAPADTLSFDPSWSGVGLGVGWYAHLSFTNHQTWDQSVVAGIVPQLNFYDCAFMDAFAFISALGTVDSVCLQGCFVNCATNNALVRGWALFWTRYTEFLCGVFRLESTGSSGGPTNWYSQDCTFGSYKVFSPVVLTDVVIQSNDGVPCAVSMGNTCLAGDLTLDGGPVGYKASAEGIPARVVLLNGAPGPEHGTASNAIGYVPSNFGDWNGLPPGDVQTALDRIASKIGPIP